MNPAFAANLFDNPLVLLAIFLVSAFSNWLMKRRQEKEARESEGRAGQERPAGRPPQPTEPQDFEEALRRLLGEEPRIEDRAPPAPPRVPSHTHTLEGELRRSTQEIPSSVGPVQPSRGRMIPAEGVAGTPGMSSRQQPSPRSESAPMQAVIAKISADRPPPANVVEASRAIDDSAFELHKRAPRMAAPSHGHAARRRTTSMWRDARRARQAFIGSLVFGPPKSLER